LQQFLRQLWRQDNGTYWLPDVRGLLVVTVVLAVLGLAVRLSILLGVGRGRDALNSNQESRSPGVRLLETGLLGLGGFVLVLFVIGRFNPTSIVFVLVPLVWILAGLPAWDGGLYRCDWVDPSRSCCGRGCFGWRGGAAA
jgi:hypothetical protein